MNPPKKQIVEDILLDLLELSMIENGSEVLFEDNFMFNYFLESASLEEEMKLEGF